MNPYDLCTTQAAYALAQGDTFLASSDTRSYIERVFDRHFRKGGPVSVGYRGQMLGTATDTFGLKVLLDKAEAAL